MKKLCAPYLVVAMSAFALSAGPSGLMAQPAKPAADPRLSSIRSLDDERLSVVRDPADGSVVVGGARWVESPCGRVPRAQLRRLSARGAPMWSLGHAEIVDALRGLEEGHVVGAAIQDLAHDPIAGDLVVAIETWIAWQDASRTGLALEGVGREGKQVASPAIEANVWIVRIGMDGRVGVDTYLGEPPMGPPLDPLETCGAVGVLTRAAGRSELSIEDDGTVSVARWQQVIGRGTGPATMPVTTTRLTPDLELPFDKMVTPNPPPLCAGVAQTGMVYITPQLGTRWREGGVEDLHGTDDCFYKFDSGLSGTTTSSNLLLKFKVDSDTITANKLLFPFRLEHMGGAVSLEGRLQVNNDPACAHLGVWEEIRGVDSDPQGLVDGTLRTKANQSPACFIHLDDPADDHLGLPPGSMIVRLWLSLVPNQAVGNQQTVGPCEETDLDFCTCNGV